MRVIQEFYCARSGSGCGGYIIVPLNMSLNGVVEIVCPKCGHKHQRNIKEGVLTEQGRYISNPTQEICPTIAAWHEEPHHPDSKKRAGGSEEREAVVLGEDFLANRWFELYGDRV